MKALPGFFMVLLVVICIGSVGAYAGAGVGIMPGKIEVEEPLYPGGCYDIPDLQVFNTGDEPGRFAVELSGMKGLDELQPGAEFFSLSPESFYLEPQANQVVTLNLTIPVRAAPGDYLGYIEAHPVSGGPGMTNIGAAAAVKIYFTVKPASTWAGMYFAAAGFISRHAVLFYGLSGTAALCLLWWSFRRRFRLNINIGLTRRQNRRR